MTSSASPILNRPLDLHSLALAYAAGLSPLDLVEQLFDRLDGMPHAGVFTLELPRAQVRAAAEHLLQRRAAGEALPLFGIPFAVKDNIDVAGLITTAACPAFARTAEEHASVVAKLLQAGALLIGKTNLDQFATGLVGVRSPYGVPENPFSAKHVPGGSSSGSAVAVARGLVSFALGTDTAGSGRVPAAFNNIVGLKPTRGMLSAHGIVPACRSLDCVSVFALTVDDAAQIAGCCSGYDARDPYARTRADGWDPRPGLAPAQFRFGVPSSADLAIGDAAARPLFARCVETLAAMGGSACELPLGAFHATSELLYHGPFVAERLEASAELLREQPAAIHPVVREILSGAQRYSAVDAQRAQTKRAALRSLAHAALRDLDFLVVPTAPIFPTLAAVEADPLGVNSELGRYTNFVNLLDLCALALPAGIRSDGLPFGVTLIALPGRDAQLASIGRVLHGKLARTLGATGRELPAPAELPRFSKNAQRARIAVVGAHLSGQPLNRELRELGARLELATRTAPHYQLYALPTTPPKPGLVRVAGTERGHAIELEVWELDVAGFGQFVSRIPGPLGIGTIELEDGSSVQGFLCEGVALFGAPDVSHFGGWRAYLRSRQAG